MKKIMVVVLFLLAAVSAMAESGLKGTSIKTRIETERQTGFIEIWQSLKGTSIKTRIETRSRGEVVLGWK